jgi:hypothetical protein
MRRLAGLAVVLIGHLAHAQFGTPPSFDATTNSSQVGGSSSNASSGTSTAVLVASALLLGVGGGISTTVFVGQSKERARARRADPNYQPRKKRKRGEALPQDPAPAPVEVQPLPLPEPGSLPVEPTPPPLPIRGSLESEDGPTLDAMVLARSWLLSNEVQLKQDLALGAGPAVDDLAGIAGIAPARRAHFAHVLQRNRKLLLAPHDLTPQQATTVMSRVGELVFADPLLRPDGEAVLAAW